MVAALLKPVLAHQSRRLHARNPKRRRKEQLRATETFRCNANHRKGMLIDIELSPDHTLISMEIALPVLIAQHDIRRTVFAFLIARTKEAAEIRLHAQDVKIISACKIWPRR